MKPRTKKAAIKACSEVRLKNSHDPKTNIVIDLMMPTHKGKDHCRTCQCSNYTTYTGFSIKGNSSEEAMVLWKMGYPRILEWVSNNLNRLTKD